MLVYTNPHCLGPGLVYLENIIDRPSFCLRLSHAIFVARAARVMEKSYPFLRYQITCRYDCRRVLKHVSKAHDILRVVRDNRKQVVGLIYTK